MDGRTDGRREGGGASGAERILTWKHSVKTNHLLTFIFDLLYDLLHLLFWEEGQRGWSLTHWTNRKLFLFSFSFFYISFGLPNGRKPGHQSNILSRCFGRDFFDSFLPSSCRGRLDTATKTEH